MYSVDLAAKNLFSQLGVPHTFFLAQPRKKRGARYLPMLNWQQMRFGVLKHRMLHSIRELEGFSHIVYWGDFLNNPRFGAEDFSPTDVANGYSKNTKEAFERWSEIFALKGGKPSARVIAAGGNFQHAFNQDEAAILGSFLHSADFVAPRDPFSFENIAPLMTSSATLIQGMDCAFLLPSNASCKRAENYFCYEFGRSSLPGTENLVRSVEAATGLTGIRLPHWLSLKAGSAHAVFEKQRKTLSSAQFILTDIYHLSVNGISSGVPVYCLGRAHDAQVGTLGDFKKKTLFSMLGLSNYYFEMGDKIDSYRSVVKTIEHRSRHSEPEWGDSQKRIVSMKEDFRSALFSSI
ncbi:hypothetical protein [Aquamicrobium soli]|uniref:Polysaccharide pyruvyl transferase domain-containing protein n=1 Tax=Aquamicrobium soli TaxID=1811518 RepID=A0ABV7K5S4_9HYPH